MHAFDNYYLNNHVALSRLYCAPRRYCSGVECDVTTENGKINKKVLICESTTNISY